jgi:hypothetical protein
MPDATIRSRARSGIGLDVEGALQQCGAFAASLTRIPTDVRMRMRAVLAVTIAHSRRAGAAPMEGLLGCAGSPSATTALAEGASANRSMEEVELAMIAAAELALRLWLARPHSSYAPAVAAAVAASRIFRLDANLTARAITLAMNGTTRLDGVHAAERARDGTYAPAAPAWSFNAFRTLGHEWYARKIVVHAHDAPPAVQTAIDACREVIAQARHLRGSLAPNEIDTIEVETSIAALQSRDACIDAIASVGLPRDRIALRPAFDLSMAAWQRLGNRVHLTTSDGHRFSADRSEPDTSPERMLAIARARLSEAGAREIYDALVHPRGGARDLIRMLSRLRPNPASSPRERSSQAARRRPSLRPSKPPTTPRVSRPPYRPKSPGSPHR